MLAGWLLKAGHFIGLVQEDVRPHRQVDPCSFVQDLYYQILDPLYLEPFMVPGGEASVPEEAIPNTLKAQLNCSG